MTAAFKVGLVAILALMATLAGLIFIWQVNPYGSYRLDVYFPNVDGLKSGAPVELMGVKVGYVSTMKTDARKVLVILSIDRETKIPVGSDIIVVTKGIVGDKAVDIIPPKDETLEYYEPKAVIENGQPPARIDTIIRETQEMLRSTRRLIEDKEMRQDILETIQSVNRSSKQMELVFKDARALTKGFGRLTQQTETLLAQLNTTTQQTVPEVRRIVAHARSIANNMDQLSGRINQIAQDPKIFAEAKGSIGNFYTLSTKWNKLTDELSAITGDIREITSDKEIKSNIKTVTQNASKLTEAILNPTVNQDKTNITFRAEMLGGVSIDPTFQLTPSVKGSFNILGDLGFGPVPHFRVGLDEIGEGNRFNLQLGRTIYDDALLRFGIVRGKLGVGSDFGFEVFGLPMTLSGEIYDINSPHMRLGVLQNVYQDYGISLYWDNEFGRGINEFSLGVHWQPK